MNDKKKKAMDTFYSLNLREVIEVVYSIVNLAFMEDIYCLLWIK